MPEGGDRRAHRRITISVPMRLEWETPGGDFRRQRGVSGDVSEIGVQAFMRHPLAVGMEVEFDMVSPAELTEGLPRRYLCRGKVVRCENIRSLFRIGIVVISRRMAGDARLQRRSQARVVPSSRLTADVVGYLQSRKVVRDINREGAFLEISQPLPVGEETQLVLQGGDLPSEIQVTAVVRRSEPNVGIGVEFTEVSREADRLLRRCIGENSTQIAHDPPMR